MTGYKIVRRRDNATLQFGKFWKNSTHPVLFMTAERATQTIIRMQLDPDYYSIEPVDLGGPVILIGGGL